MSGIVSSVSGDIFVKDHLQVVCVLIAGLATVGKRTKIYFTLIRASWLSTLECLPFCGILPPTVKDFTRSTTMIFTGRDWDI